MTTWNTPSDKGLKSRTEDSKNNSENIWGILPKIFIKRYMTQNTQKIYRTISCCPRNIKKMLRRKKQKERIKREDLATGQLKIKI